MGTAPKSYFYWIMKTPRFTWGDKNFVLDYKNPEQLKKFINDKGKILPRRTTGACAKHQRDITIAIKRARHIALLPYTQN